VLPVLPRRWEAVPCRLLSNALLKRTPDPDAVMPRHGSKTHAAPVLPHSGTCAGNEESSPAQGQRHLAPGPL